jgi:hypothetical protein
VGHKKVTLRRLGSSDRSRYVCPRCFFEVVLPRRVEARLLRELPEDQTDQFGNPSPFRTWLARKIRPYALGHRPYALVTIPDIEIRCPHDGTTLEAWRDYPEIPSLVCPRCGSRTHVATDTGEIGFDVLTDW